MSNAYRFDEANFNTSTPNSRWITTLEDAGAPETPDRTSIMVFGCLAALMCAGMVVSVIGMWNYSKADASRTGQTAMVQADANVVSRPAR